MRIKLKIFSTIFILAVFANSRLSSQSFGNWSILENKSPLKSISFVNSTTGYIFGPGLRWKTTNQGQNWVFINNEPSNLGTISPRSVVFINELTGLATRNSWDVMRTQNSGESWFKTPTRLIIGKSLHFINENTGFLYGQKTVQGINIIKTTNGGNNWSDVVNPDLGNEIKSLHFINVNKGFAIGNAIDTFAVTTNGGNHWKKVALQGSSSNSLIHIHFTDQNHGWILSNYQKIFRTTDGGDNWNFVFTGLQWLKYMFFLDSLNGWVLGDNFIIKRTNDGGITWLNQGTISAFPLESIYFQNQNSGWVIGVDGHINKTTDGGLTWNKNFTLTNQPLTNINFLNNQTGWVVSTGSDKGIWKTTDSGRTWIKKYNNASLEIKSLFILNEQTAYASGTSGSLVKTTNGGDNWSTQNIGEDDLNSIHFFNPSTGYLVSSKGSVHKTINGGLNWQNVYSNSLLNLKSIFAYSESRCIAVGLNSVVLTTSNGGISWFETTLDDINHNQVYFVNNLTGFIISSKNFSLPFGTKNMVYKTEDGGESFSVVFNLDAWSTDRSLKSIHFSDSLHGIIVGNRSMMLRTANGGTNWTYMNSPIPYIDINFNTITFKNNIGWIAGDYGTVLTTNQNTIGIDPINTTIPISFSLSQNYPNPFNPSTKIKFSLPSAQFTKLKVYNSLGQEITTLVNQQLQPGSYEYTYDASGLSSGVYFYRLEAGDPSGSSGQGFVETKRMVILK